jgi:hypothetical protein
MSLLVIWLFYEYVRYELRNDPPELVFIDFSEVLSKSYSDSNVEFIIPRKFNPTYIKSSQFFTFYLSAPEHDLPFKKLGTGSSDSLRVLIRAVDDEKKMRSVNKLKYFQNKKPVRKNVPYFVGREGDFEKHQYEYGSKKTIAFYYHKIDNNRKPIVIDDPGEWSAGYRVYRRLNKNIEIDYVFSKELGIKQWDILDKYILRTINSFQQPL